MYTDESFEILGVFTLLRPIFITILTFVVVLFLSIIISKFQNRLVNRFTVLSLSAISILVSGQLLWYSGIIVDEIGLGGDSVSTYMFIAIVGLSIINIFIPQNKAEKDK